MEPQDRKLLEETAKLAKENHKMLKSMHRKQSLATIVSVIKWIIIVIVTLWAWVLIQPMIEQVAQLYTQVQDTSKAVADLKVQADGALENSGLQDLLNIFRMGSQQ